MFTEEVEDDEVKVEQIKKEVTKVSIEGFSWHIQFLAKVNYRNILIGFMRHIL